MPQDPPKPRPPGSSPAIPTVVEQDRTLYGADRQPRADSPERKQTLVGLGRASGEFGATVPAPAPKPTLKRPPPPSAAERAQRSDAPLPRPGAWSSGYEPSVPPSAEPSQEPPSASPLPPPSSSPEEASRAAKDRELARLRRERNQARAEAAVWEGRAQQPEATAVSPAPPETFRGVTLTQAKIGLLVAVTALITILTPYLAWKVSTLQGNAARTETQATEASRASEAVKAAASGRDKEIAELRAQRQADWLYLLAVLRKQGVEARKPENWPDLPTLETEAPLRKPGKVSDGVVLVIKTPIPTVKATP